MLVGIVELAAQRLAELELDNSGNGLLLSSLYANGGSWESVIRKKKMIKKKRLIRFPDSSWVSTV